MEIEAIKASQIDATLVMENQRKKSEATEASISNRMNEIKEKLRCRGDNKRY